ncbi:MAG: membrane protein insertase YidC [Actinomycetota bacterium]|nr:membrane protein insertase YidC [Rubrobacteraceae bacterium]MBA3615811.1 membrane protein insertase YidC [Rubrobacteraceae bacterium]MDQ3183020.1 membrane protein insertase YidC [Actinomycetota bacterium]MDQ3498339.1 membrane protein insertase YidC [Actinomycetota bacterium]
MINNIADFFANLFSPIVSVLGVVLLYFHQTLGAPWWLAIVLLTVIVRSLLFPLTVKQVRSMRAMQDLKPHMDRVRAQFKDNPQRQREEMAKVYQDQGVNPLGGCLPILVQMPIFIGIFYVIRQFGGYSLGDRTVPPQYPSFHEGGILWFQNLSNADPTYLLPIISAVTMLAATEITAKNIDPQQRWLMRLLPIGFTIFLLNFPAGLFMYWITSNLVTLVQNFVIYNYGPGKKTSGDTKGTDNGKSKATSGDRQAQDSSSEQTSANSQEVATKQAAKIAKRKRRKKKK